jgi:hypothetical protein
MAWMWVLRLFRFFADTSSVIVLQGRMIVVNIASLFITMPCVKPA